MVPNQSPGPASPKSSLPKIREKLAPTGPGLVRTINPYGVGERAA